MPRRQIPDEDYTVGWICALPIELAAAQVMLDEKHGRLLDDDAIYTLGRIHHFNVVIASLPAGQTGTVPAASVAEKMVAAFKSIRIVLMVGIGGGVPAPGADIRLGDVVISTPLGAHGGVVQYDFGKTTPRGFERTGFLNTPPRILLNAVTNLRANHLRGQCGMPGYLDKFDALPQFSRETAGPDLLFRAEYDHQGTTCEQCSKDELVPRKPRSEWGTVHYGTIASGNRVMRSGSQRDLVSAELDGVLCFEMEAAGLMNNFPCLVIRGICDYADSHKNKTWQGYAAGAAAACAKEVLSVIPPEELIRARTAEVILESGQLPYFLPLRSSPTFNS